MNNFFTLVLIILFVQAALSAPENLINSKYTVDYLQSVVKTNLKSFIGTVNTLNGQAVQIGYLKLENPNGHLGTLVVLSGRAESSMKFIEVAEDFLVAGFKTVFVLDQRGQGFSSRLLPHQGPQDPDYDKVHMDKAENMNSDFEKFVSEIMLRESPAPYFSLGHITGALPLTDYLQKNESHSPFSKVVMVSPLFEIKTTKSKRFLFDHILTPLLSDSARVPFETKKNTLGEFETNNRTGSKSRFNLVKSTIALFPESASISSTMRWAKEMFSYQPSILNSKHTIKTQILMITAKNDELLANKTSETFCMNASKNLNCQYVEVPNAKHWLLFEKDEVRSFAFDLIGKFLVSDFSKK